MIDPDNRCDLCGQLADVTAAYWRTASAFDPPTGYACESCNPRGFELIRG